MPILPLERDLYPEGLFAEKSRADNLARCWWVLHTKPRQEKSLARQLLASEVPFYLPLIPRRLFVRSRELTSHVPLFPGYLFLLGSGEERLAALSTNRVAGALQVPEQERLWHDLTQLQRLIQTGAPITPQERLAPGMIVEIRNGPLAGLKGKIVKASSRRHFVVEIDFIQRGASVVFEDAMLAQAEH
jgi:transcription antitermination factor NusG